MGLYIQGARDKNFLVLLVVHSVGSLSPKTGRERTLKKDRAAMVPLTPWSRAISQILTPDNSGGISGPVMCLRD